MSDYVDKYIYDQATKYFVEQAKKAVKKDPPGFIKKVYQTLVDPNEYALNSFSNVVKHDPFRLLDLGNDTQLLYDKVTGNKTGETDRAERNILHAMGERYKPREAIFNVLTNVAPLVASALAGAAITTVPAVSKTTKNLAKEIPENFLPKYIYKKGRAIPLHGKKPIKEVADMVELLGRRGKLPEGELLDKMGQPKVISDSLRAAGLIDYPWEPKYVYRAAGYYTPILDKKPTKHAADNIDYFTKTGWINKKSKLDKDGFPIVGLDTKIRGDLHTLGLTAKSAAKVGATKGAIIGELLDAPTSAGYYYMSRYNKPEPELKPSSESKPEPKKDSGMSTLLKGIALSLLNADIEDPARFNKDDVKLAYYTIFGQDKVNEARKNNTSPRELISEIRAYNREHPDEMDEIRERFIRNKANNKAKKDKQ